jgi:membrane-bound lytic murein transglycosylase B
MIQRRALLRRLSLTAWPVALLGGAGAADARQKNGREPLRPEHEPGSVAYRGREDVAAFALQVAQRHGLEAQWTLDALARARRIPSVERLIMPAPQGTAKNWAAYRARAIEAVRIRAGLAFWAANEAWLAKAEERWGVPADIVVGIIGIETLYGRHMGHYRVLDALATLSFDFPSGRSDRSPFFRSELESFLLLCHSQALAPGTPRGSYAGAMGLGQFMPSSVARYALDFDEDGTIDLNASAADAIGSVAHYLAAFGWQRDLPPRFPVAPPALTLDKAVLLVPDIVPSFTPSEFTERGAQLGADLTAFEGKLALVELHNGDAAPSYVAGTQNFYTITRYNWSSYYALAVIELGEAIARERPRGSVYAGPALAPTLSAPAPALAAASEGEPGPPP